MDRWVGKVAVVTGASSGIGLAIARSFLENGMVVVGLARRSELMQERLGNLSSPSKFYAKKCDISNEQQVKVVFTWIKDTLKNINVLVNNAGTIKINSLLDMPGEDIDHIINVNLMGTLYCTREAGKLMQQSDEEAVIVNMNSVMAHFIPTGMPINVYPATKSAIKAISEICRKEFINHKNIRVANVSPGLVFTEILNNAENPTSDFEAWPILQPEDVAQSVLHIILAPAHVNITELVILPTGSAFP